MKEVDLMAIEGHIKDLRCRFSEHETEKYPPWVLKVYDGIDGTPGGGLWSDGRVAWMETTIHRLIAEVRRLENATQ